MWTIVKFDKKYLSTLKKELSNKLKGNLIFYSPKILIQKYRKNQLVNIETNIVGDYLFCFHEDFKDPNTFKKLQFCKGLKYFLFGCSQSQNEIHNFIEKCKNSEDANGFISSKFYEICKNTNYKLATGPFAEKIFKMVNFQRNKIEGFLGNIKTTIKRDKFLYSPV